jgi:hypothetical protein
MAAVLPAQIPVAPIEQIPDHPHHQAVRPGHPRLAAQPLSVLDQRDTLAADPDELLAITRWQRS